MSRSSFSRLPRQMAQAFFREAASKSSKSSGSSVFADQARTAARFNLGGSPVLQGWGMGKAGSAAPGAGSFAASGLRSPPHAPQQAMPCAVDVQVRSATTVAAEDDGEGEGMSTTRRSRVLPAVDGGEDDEDTLSHVQRLFRKRKREGGGPSGFSGQSKQERELNQSRDMDQADPLEFRMLAKDSFLKKPIEMVPIPEKIREVLFRYSWDKVLVDVRRTIVIAERGKHEVYTAMVAVGNLDVGYALRRPWSGMPCPPQKQFLLVAQGLLGLGMADAPTAQDAVAKAHMDSYSNLKFIPLYHGHTIYHRIDHAFHRMKMRLMPRHDGFGIKASDLVSELCGLTGIKNISIKMVGRSQNKFYVAHCLQEALSMQSTPHDGVEGTGVYVRETLWTRPGVQLPMGLQRGVDVL